VEDFGGRGFASADLALQKDGSADGGELFDLLNQLFDRSARTDDSRLDVAGGGGVLGAGVLLFRLELFELDAPLQGGDQLIDTERLLQVVEGSELECLDGAFGAGVRGHDDDDAGRVVRFEMLE